MGPQASDFSPSQLLASSLLRNNLDCEEEVLTSKTEADLAGICHPCSSQQGIKGVRVSDIRVALHTLMPKPDKKKDLSLQLCRPPEKR